MLAAWAGLLSAPSSAAPSADPDPVRILIVGDSMTHGSRGDWTWRYRLWQHFQDAGVAVDFVGPRDDIWEASQAYVDPEFDRDHASKWGLALALMSADYPVGIGSTIADLVEDYQPDVVLELVGVNDLTFLGESPEELRDRLRDFVVQAREEDPGIDVVLGRIPQPWQTSVPAFNGLVDDLADELDLPTSRVVVAATDAGYDRAEDTWDNFHPDARGELKIAAAFEDALAGLGPEYGPPATRPLPDVPLGPRLLPVLTGTPGVATLGLTWQESPGATDYAVRIRDLTAGNGWVRVAEDLVGTSYDVTDLPAWHQIEAQLLPAKGKWEAAPDAWSNVVTAQVLGSRLDRPTATASARADGVATVGWQRVLGATSYAVQWRRLDQPGDWLGPVVSIEASATVGGLTNRAAYGFRVRAERGALAGEWSDLSATAVPALGAVTGARLTRLSRALKARARPVAFATSYTLEATAAPSCRRQPGSRKFELVAAGLPTAEKRFRLVGRAVWVRWVAVRWGVDGDRAPSSSECVRLR